VLFIVEKFLLVDDYFAVRLPSIALAKMIIKILATKERAMSVFAYFAFYENSILGRLWRPWLIMVVRLLSYSPYANSHMFTELITTLRAH